MASGEGQYPLLLFVVAVDDKRAGAEKKKIVRVGGGIGCAGHAPFGTASDGGIQYVVACLANVKNKKFCNDWFPFLLEWFFVLCAEIFNGCSLLIGRLQNLVLSINSFCDDGFLRLRLFGICKYLSEPHPKCREPIYEAWKSLLDSV